jgi:uncharacterized membrane protein
MAFLRFLMLLALVVWIGGIIFFSFVEAPTLFTVLPTTRMAGDVVNASLGKLHWIGLVLGIVFLVCSLLYDQLKHGKPRAFAASHVFVFLMLLLTAYSQFSITPRMRDLRAEMQSATTLAANDPQRLEFDRLHAWSTRVEGTVLFLGLGVVALTARRFS